MGMAASQARLLTITARMHDVEYKAQNIMNQKTALATQKDELYDNYMEALDAKKIQVAYTDDGITKNYIDATYATLCKYDPNRCTDYVLKDDLGKILVDEKTYDLYVNEGFDNDKYAFAWAMLGMDDMGSWNGEDDLNCVGYGTSNTTESGNLFMTEVEQAVFDRYVEDSPILKSAWEGFQSVDQDETKTTAEKKQALQDFRNTLYSELGSEIYRYMRLDKQDDSAKDPDSASTSQFDNNFPENYESVKGELQYYVHLFEAIKDAGGCTIIDAANQSGDNGNEWLNNMVNAGKVTISVYNKYGTNTGWTDTSVATSTTQNYLQEVQDETDLKKAEAEYEHELDKINRKDTKFDQDLNKLETERTSLKTEMESIKKVKDDNIERTYSIFS